MFVPLVLIFFSLGLMIYVFLRLTKHSVIAVHKYIRINCYFALSGSILYLLGLLFSVHYSIVFDILRFVTSLAYLNMFIALFTMSSMICYGIVRSFIQPIKIGSSRIEMVEMRFSKWYDLHVFYGNRISFMIFIFYKLSEDYLEQRVKKHFTGVFITTIFFGINSFYFLGNVLSQMSMIDKIAPSVGYLNTIQPLIESFQYLVLWSIKRLTLLFGFKSLLIAFSTYEFVMLIFFIRKRQILQRHQHELFYYHTDAEIQEFYQIENAYGESASEFWKRTVFGPNSIQLHTDVRGILGELYNLDGKHWAIEYRQIIRNDDFNKMAIHKKVELAQRDSSLWDKITDEEYWIYEECRSFDLIIFNNIHSLTVHGENKKVIDQSPEFPKDVLEMIQLRIQETNSSIID